MKLNSDQFALLAETAAQAGGRARANYVGEGMRSGPCVAVDSLDVKAIWNLSSLLAERDLGLSRSLRGPAVDATGHRFACYWPGVTAD